MTPFKVKPIVVMRNVFYAASVLALLLLGGLSAAEPNGGVLILNETAYCRAYYHLDVQKIGPKALKSDGEKILGATLMNRLEKQVKKRLASKNVDWQKEDWREHVTASVEYNSFARKNKVFLTVEGITAPPADGWSGLDFDDTTWPHQKKPDGVGSPAEFTYDTLERNGWMRGIFLRFRFEIPDPTATGAVTLSADFIGGLRAFVNGTEVVREHLPAGNLDAETMADEYPEQAYGITFSELPQKDKAQFKGKEPPVTEIVKSADEMTPLGSRLYKARNLTVNALTIPAQLLHKGTNVLAIELRAAPLHPYTLKNWFGYRGEDRQWEHAQLSRLELRCTDKGAASALNRPTGVQVWTEDLNRRMLSPEFLEAGAAPGEIVLCGARNGTYSAQLVVGTDKELTNVKVSVSELKSATGGTLPSASIKVFGMMPQPVGDMSLLGEGRIVGLESGEFGGGNNRHGDWSAPKTRALNAFAPETLENKNAATAALGRIQYFDWISAAQPQRIAANSCRPYWVSIKIPADAAPGIYRGTVRVEGPEITAVTLPIHVEMLDWKIPEPRDFQTVVAIEQSPYGVAKQYKTPLWSEKHWTLIEASLRLLSRVGNRCWLVPVLLETEFGNKDDSMIKWICKPDGTLAFDYAVLDRYLDLIVKHCGTPRVITFVVMHGFPGAMEVKVSDEATGKEERVTLGPAVPDREKYWKPFAVSLYAHMTSKGLAKMMYWGYPWDSDGDPALKPLLRKCAPEVYWTCGSHDANVSVTDGMPDISSPFYVPSPFGSRAFSGQTDVNAAAFYKVVENIQSFLIEGESKKGWKGRDQILLCTPRVDCGAIVVNGTQPPWAFRIFPERAIFTGYQGTGRMGGDYWAKSYHDGCKHNGGAPGFSIMKSLWPGPDGAEPSARFEAMIEGLQELEARIFVEQALDKGLLPEDKARHVTEELARHYKGTFAGGLDWQARSKAIYKLAAEVAGIIGQKK